MAGMAAASLLVFGASPSFAKDVHGAQSATCWARAKQRGLGGDTGAEFHARCMKGALAPTAPTKFDRSNDAAKAITSPSGTNRMARSDACNAEATRRGLHDSAFQAFRKGCVASAAPVGAIQAPNRTERPAPALPKIESQTNRPPPR
jgi:hypothetical protein